MSEEVISLDLEPITVRYRIGGQQYVLLEADEGSVCVWRNAQTRAAQMKGGEVASLGDLADSEPLLLSLCLYRADISGDLPRSPDGAPDRKALVGVATVRSWPRRIVGPLFEKVMEISGLRTKEDQKVLEKKFQETARQLVALSVDDNDRRKWDEWLTATVREAVGTTPAEGTPEEAAKNSHGRTAPISA